MDRLRPMLKGLLSLKQLRSLWLKNASYHPIPSLELSMFLKAMPAIEALQIQQPGPARGKLQDRFKMLPLSHLSCLARLSLKHVCSLKALRDIVAAAPKLQELLVGVPELTNSEALAAREAWTAVCTTWVTVSKGTLRSVKLEFERSKNKASILSPASCDALAQIGGLTVGPVLTDPLLGAHGRISHLPVSLSLHLQVLDLAHCKTRLTKQIVSDIALLPRLVEFKTPARLKGSKHPGSALAMLKKSASLKVLSLNNVNLNSRHLRAILSIQTLKEITLSKCNGSGVSDEGIYAAGLYEDVTRKICLKIYDCGNITFENTEVLMHKLLPCEDTCCYFDKDSPVVICDRCEENWVWVCKPVWPSSTEKIVACETCATAYCGDCWDWRKDDDNDDDILRNHTWRECAGCGPEARGMSREDFKATTGESWAHCYECLRTYWGSEDQPLVCERCITDLESGKSAWEKDTAYS